MRNMKDSGVEWIGEIPEGWEVTRLKNISELYTGNSIKTELKDSYLDTENSIPYISTKDIDADNGKIDYSNGMFVKQNDIDFKRAPKNSTLLCIEGGSAGKKIGFTNQEVAFVNKLCCIFSNRHSPKFINYYIQSPAFFNEFSSNLSGLIGGVAVGILNNLSITLPTIAEQQKIATYLDEKVALIDNIIEKTKESIEEYKRYKQSLITETVTKGLNKNAKMKDSGIEWIGEIPEGWGIAFLGQVYYQVKNKNIGNRENNLLSLSYGNIIRKDINTSDGLLPESFEGYNIVEKNDIVLRLTDLQNDHKSLRVGLVTERGIITSAYVTIRNKIKVNSYFMYYLIHSFDIYKGFYGMGSGVRQGLTYDGIKSFKFIIPPLCEQNEIVALLNIKSENINKLIKQKEELISNLESYKKSLIYEVVTGKKEV